MILSRCRCKFGKSIGRTRICSFPSGIVFKFCQNRGDPLRGQRLRILLTCRQGFQLSSQEVTNLMPGNPDRVLWLGIKLLNKSMSAIICNALDCETGGKNFQRGKACYQALKNQKSVV